LTGSRSVLLALFAVMLVLCLGLPRWKPLALVGLLLVGLLGGYYVLHHSAAITSRGSGDLDISTSQRVILWYAGILEIKSHPLVGVGYGQFQPLSEHYAADVDSALHEPTTTALTLGNFPAHNDFLTMWVSFGPIGLILYFLLQAIGAFYAWSIWRKSRDPLLRAIALGCLAGLVAYFVHECVHNGFEDSLSMWVLLGAILALFNVARFKLYWRRSESGN
jgi:O-antigen ligase